MAVEGCFPQRLFLAQRDLEHLDVSQISWEISSFFNFFGWWSLMFVNLLVWFYNEYRWQTFMGFFDIRWIDGGEFVGEAIWRRLAVESFEVRRRKGTLMLILGSFKGLLGNMNFPWHLLVSGAELQIWWDRISISQVSYFRWVLLILGPPHNQGRERGTWPFSIFLLWFYFILFINIFFILKNI